VNHIPPRRLQLLLFVLEWLIPSLSPASGVLPGTGNKCFVTDPCWCEGPWVQLNGARGSK